MNSVYITMVSHGRYIETGETFTVPHNIALIQYSVPNSILSLVEANHIMNVTDSNYNLTKDLHLVKPFYLISRHDGEIYNSKYEGIVVLPGSQTKNLQLDFTKDIPGFIMGIKDSNGAVVTPKFDSVTTTLNNAIIELSRILPQDKLTYVIQLSCRMGNYSIPDKQELERAVLKCNSDDDFIHVLNIDTTDKTIFDERNFFYTENKEQAVQVSCLIDNKFPLDHFYTTDDIFNYTPKQESIYKDKDGDIKLIGGKRKMHKNNKIKRKNKKYNKTKNHKHKLKKINKHTKTKRKNKQRK